MHALNTNEEMKMKKINYFGKEYTVSDDVKWVATNSYGTVMAFTYEPIQDDSGWAGGVFYPLDRLPSYTIDWKNSLRKVEDILVIEETPTPSGHPHADLILKYAMIAQYDDKPWKNFECDLGNDMWCDMFNTNFHTAFNYRLKPQPPVVQIGQIWVSEEGTNVMVDTPSDTNTIYFKYQLGGLLIKNAVSLTHFIKHFKRKS